MMIASLIMLIASLMDPKVLDANGRGFCRPSGKGKFELQVLRNTVSEEQWDRRFTSGKFVVEEAFQVPEELFAAGIELKVGSYPVEVVGEYLRISF